MSADDPVADSSATPSSASTTRPTRTPTPLAFPPAAPDEIVRAEFRAEGSGGVPASTSTAGMIEVDSIAIEGECRGTSMGYRLTAAAEGSDLEVITEGTMMCDAPVRNQIADLGYAGRAQLSIDDANSISEGWVVVVPLD